MSKILKLYGLNMSASYFMLRFLRNRREKRFQKLSSLINRDKNNINNMVNKCRICLKAGNIPIFRQGSRFDIPNAIATFGGVIISEDDDYPKHLCSICYKFLENGVLFRKSAKESDKILRENLHQVFYDGTIEDIEDPIENYFSDNKLTSNYNCKFCNVQFDSGDKLITHKHSKCYKKIRIQCSICFGLLTPSLYKKHLARHEAATHLVCEICGKLYRKANLARHLQLHSNELPFQCQQCPYRGRFVESLKLHMRTHTGDKPYSCDKCQLRFLTRSNLNRHLLTHRKDRPYKCLECIRGFYTKTDMEAHVKSDHIGVKEFLCKMCGNKFAKRKGLMKHELTVHKRSKMATGRLPLYLQAEYQKQNNKINRLLGSNDKNCEEYSEKE